MKRKQEPTGVGDILESLKKTSALGKQLDQAKIWERWEEMVGKPWSEHGTPHTLKEQKLTLHIDTAVWMHQFAYRKWVIIKAINRFAGYELVSDLFLVLRPDEETVLPQDGV